MANAKFSMKGALCYMIKALAPQKTAPSSLLSRHRYKAVVSPVKKSGKSVMSMAKYNKDSGVEKHEQKETRTD